MLILSLTGLCFIFIFNFVFWYIFGYKHYWFFELMHFLGGFFVAMLLYNFLHSAVAILAGVGAVTIIWEGLEVLVAKIRTTSKFIKKEFKQKDITPKFGDTFLDVILNFIGAILFIFLNRGVVFDIILK